MGYAEFVNQWSSSKQNKSRLATESEEDILSAIFERNAQTNPFPLDVFHKNVKPFISALNLEYDIPESFIGLMLLSSYSTAIGTAYTVSTNNSDNIYLGLWACMLGLSSSGKTIVMNKVYEGLNEIQREMDRNQDFEQNKDQNKKLECVLYRDSHVPTLARVILADNPKGVCKVADELVEWINGFDPFSNKEGTDTQFWMSTFNATAYSAIRAGRTRIFVPRPFVNVAGGTQYDMVPKFFSKGRDSSGFVFRILFAVPDKNKICYVNPYYSMPAEIKDIHSRCLKSLFSDLYVDSHFQKPKRAVLNEVAVKLYNSWAKNMAETINYNNDSLTGRNINAGIYGKIREYSLRFAALLAISDFALNNLKYDTILYPDTLTIDEGVMSRAIALSDYFYNSAKTVYAIVNAYTFAPREVMEVANMQRRGMSLAKIALHLYKSAKQADIQRLHRNLKKWEQEYHWVFNSKNGKL